VNGTPAEPASSPGLLPSVWWVVVGVLGGLGVVGILTIGPPLLALAGAMAIGGAAMARTRNRSAYLVLAGASVVPFLLAWLNRGGPGTVCQSVASDGTACVDEWSPWPFLVVGFVLLAVGVLATVRHTGSAAPASPAGSAGSAP
jgi:hypothetical protein